MYAALWRVLPGPLWARISILVVAAAGLIALLAFVIYPWVATVVTPGVESTVQ
jgi:hypothetical protein